MEVCYLFVKKYISGVVWIVVAFWRGAKKPLDESERGEWKSWLKAQHSGN